MPKKRISDISFDYKKRPKKKKTIVQKEKKNDLLEREKISVVPERIENGIEKEEISIENRDIDIHETETLPLEPLSFNDEDQESEIAEISSEEVEKVYEDLKPKEVSTNTKRIYVGYETRVCFMILCMLIFFFLAIFLMVKSFGFEQDQVISVKEKTISSYKVCLDEENIIQCLSEGAQYDSRKIDRITTTVEYEADYSDEIDFSSYYYVIGNYQVYERGKLDQTLVSDQDVLISRTKMDSIDKKTKFTAIFDVLYQDYYLKAKEQESYYTQDIEAFLDVELYVENNGQSRKVSSLSIPLNEGLIEISKEDSNDSGIMEVPMDSWSSIDVYYGSFSVIFFLLGLFMMIYMMRFIHKATYPTVGKYQRTLDKILKTYDSMIVISEDGYSIEDGMVLKKVTSFSDLIQLRGETFVPIVYVRVNSIKSEFYLELGGTVYKYTLKDREE